MKLRRKKVFELCCLAVGVAAIFNANAAEKLVWSEGHGDLAVNFVNGGWEWNAEEGKEVDDVIIRLNDVTRNAIPENTAFSFLGDAGAPIWIIPTAQTVGIPFLGINAARTPIGTFINDRFDLHLSNVNGSGDFIMWTTTGTGTPTILMNSRDGITTADKTTVPAAGHFHQNWGFTSPGTYRVGFKASGVQVGQSAPTNSDEAVYTFEVNVLKNGEADIELAYENGSLEFHIHDELANVELDPAHVALQAGPATWQSVPTNAAFSFLGAPGASVYVLPQDETEGVLFLGLAAGEVSAGIFANDAITVKLISVEGPGYVAYYQIDQFGMPAIALNSADGITAGDSVTVAAGSHAHRNWSFTEPGVYRVTLQASGTLVSGGEVRSEPATFLFEVLPPTFLDTGEIDFEIAFTDGNFGFGLLDEAAGQELGVDEAVLVLKPRGRQTVPNDPAFNFLGTTGAPVFVLPQEETEGLLFLGIAGDEIQSGQFANETVRLELVSASGPGSFAIYSVDAFGAPTVYMNTANGVSSADVFPIAVGSHTHANWSFTQPGEYSLNFKASGTLVGTNQPSTSETVTLRFLVEASTPQTGPTLTASYSKTGRQLQVFWSGRSGVTYQLQSRSSVATGNWLDVGAAITGVAGTQTVNVDIGTDTLKIFRLLETPR